MNEEEFKKQVWDDCVQPKLDRDEFVEFEGDWDCEGCFGWDGESRRCDCGNRRVYWQWTGYSYIAVAY